MRDHDTRETADRTRARPRFRSARGRIRSKCDLSGGAWGVSVGLVPTSQPNRLAGERGPPCGKARRGAIPLPSPRAARRPGLEPGAVRGPLALRELRRLARLVQAGLLALDPACVTGEEPLALEQRTEVGVDLDERARDPVAD